MPTRRFQQYAVLPISALFIVLAALALNHLFPAKEDTHLHFYGNSTIEQVKAFAASQNKAFIVLEDQFAERGHGHFFTAKIGRYPTECGDADIRLSFFNNQLYHIALENVSEIKSIPQCSQQQLKHMNGNITVRGKTISYDNPAIVEKLNQWIRKWS